MNWLWTKKLRAFLLGGAALLFLATAPANAQKKKKNAPPPDASSALPLPDEQQFGFQLMLSFWSWGDTEEEAMGNLDRTVQNIWEALRAVVREAKESIAHDA